MHAASPGEITSVTLGQDLWYFGTEFQPTNRPRLCKMLGPGARPGTANVMIWADPMADIGKGGKAPLTVRKDVPVLRYHPKRIHESGQMAIFPATLLEQFQQDPGLARFVEGFAARFEDVDQGMPAIATEKKPAAPPKVTPKADGGAKEDAGGGDEPGVVPVDGSDGGPLDGLRKHPSFSDTFWNGHSNGVTITISPQGVMSFLSSKQRVLCQISAKIGKGETSYRLFLPAGRGSGEGQVLRKDATTSRSIGALLRFAGRIVDNGIHAATAKDVQRAFEQARDETQPRE